MKKMITLALVLSFLNLAMAQNRNFIDQPYIEVNGAADTLVTPDQIFIRIILSEKDTRDRISIEELEQKMVEGLKSLGIDTEKDLTTSDMTSNFKYYILKTRDVLKSKIYTLKVTNAIVASQVFIKLEESGISNTSIDRVDHSDVDNLNNLMRTKAIADAKARAVALTKPLNQTVGSAIHIVDPGMANPQLNGQLAGIRIRGTSSLQSDFKEKPKIEFEKMRIAASINAKFALN